MSQKTTPNGGSAAIPPEEAPRAAFDVTLAAARLASPVIEGPHGQRHIIVPDGFRLHDAHDPHALPPDIASRVIVDDRRSLSDYVNRFSDHRTILVADYDQGAVMAYLDWHTANAAPLQLESSFDEALAPQPRSHVAKLQLRPSEEFKRWAEIEGKFHSQEEFAAFLEENAVDVVDPEPGVLIEISRDLEGTQGVTFKSSTRLENGDRSFVYETETRAKGDIKIPREFMLLIPLYQGEEPTELRCAFRWRLNGGQLQLGFAWRRVEYQRQAYFAQLATQAAEETGRPVFFGRVTA